MNELLNKIIIDDEYKYLLHKYSFSIGGIGYPHCRVNGKWKYLHHLILPKKDGLYVDHINRNKLDCRKNNLRYADKYQNASNSSKNLYNTSGYKGVVFYKRTGKWMAQITSQRKYKCLGYFNNIEDASNAYKNKAIELFGNYAGEF